MGGNYERKVFSIRHESQKPQLPYNNLSRVIIDGGRETSALHQLEADDNGTQRKACQLKLK